MTAIAARSTGKFRYENDMVDVLEPTFASSIFRRNDPNVITFREVPAARGVPDLVAVRFDPIVMALRTENEIRCLSSDLEVRVVQALRYAGPLELRELGAHLGLSSRDYLRRSVLPMLEQLGWLTVSSGKVALRPGTQPVARRVITIEAKLRDWLRAFNQARSQLYSADAAYIALDEASSSNALGQLDAIAERGVGVITVNADTKQHRVVIRPKRVLSKSRTSLGRELLAERSLNLLRSGSTAGQVFPVFGWLLPVTDSDVIQTPTI